MVIKIKDLHYMKEMVSWKRVLNMICLFLFMKGDMR
jgi:hypothetical protein